MAVVEFAPYQKIPTEKKKADARSATIEKGDVIPDTLLRLEPYPPQMKTIFLS